MALLPLGPSVAFALQGPAAPAPPGAALSKGRTAPRADAGSEWVPRVVPAVAGASLLLLRRGQGQRKQAVAAVRRRARGGAEAAEAVMEKEEIKGLEGQVVDEAAMLAKSTFAIKPEALIRLCKEVLARGAGTTKEGEKDLAEDFEFCAPVVGPIGKEQYLNALGTFKILEAFPDNNNNYHFFRVDPFETDRVWFQTRKTATNTGEFMKKPATGKALVFPPEAYSLRFNEEGKVKEFTVGYPMDRRAGNTGGLGGAFGFFYGVGRPLPIPECQPYKPSWQFRLLRFVGRMGTRLRGGKAEEK